MLLFCVQLTSTPVMRKVQIYVVKKYFPIILTLLQPTRNKPKSPLYYQPEINRNVISPTIDDQAEINRNLIANILVLYKRVIQVFIKLFMSIFHQKHIQEVF